MTEGIKKKRKRRWAAPRLGPEATLPWARTWWIGLLELTLPAAAAQLLHREENLKKKNFQGLSLA